MSNRIRAVRIAPACILGSILALATATAQAAMYKWKDANGGIHYGSTPPAGASSTLIKKQQAPPHSPASSEATANPIKAEADRMQKMREESQQQKAEIRQKKQREKARKKHCKGAHRNLAELQRGGRHPTTMPDGEVKYLTPEEKRAMIDHANRFIAENCTDDQ